MLLMGLRGFANFLWWKMQPTVAFFEISCCEWLFMHRMGRNKKINPARAH